MDVRIASDWKAHLQEEFEKEYFEKLAAFVKEEYATHTIYPPGKQIFEAFEQCSWDELKVVIIGQDPYHGPGQANGLCFSVNDGIKFPPSLRNIFKAIGKEYDRDLPLSGDLTRWAKQGILLLNATLTVRAAQAGSHQKKGWEVFTDKVIETIANEKENIVYFLWGSYARSKKSFIDASKNLVLESVHPSPLSAHRGFFDTGHFKEAEAYIREKHGFDIQW